MPEYSRSRKDLTPAEALSPYVPPNSIEAEQSVLGAMLIERVAIIKANSILTVSDFYRETHQILFAVINDLVARDSAVDLITVSEELKNRNKYENIGGPSYLTALFERVPTAANIEYYSKIVRDKSILRKLISASMEIIGSARGEIDNILDMVNNAQRMIMSVKINSDDTRGRRSMAEIIPEVWSEAERNAESGGNSIVGLSTGFAELDRMSGGLQPGDFIIVAGRPSMGKTHFALWVASHAALDEKVGVLFVSREMDQMKIGRRLLASRSCVPTHIFRSGRMNIDDWNRSFKACETVATDFLHVDDKSSTPAEILISAREFQHELYNLHFAKLGLIVVDYIQICDPDTKCENRRTEVSSIAKGLCKVGRELGVPVIALSQLSRKCELRENKRPMLSDLNESGDIEAAADAVIFPYRESYYARMSKPEEMRDKEPDVDELEIIIGKYRDGFTGVLPKVGFAPALGIFYQTAPAINTDGSTGF
jgi:replicative DNA helicase